jgi:hypothetical protein
VRREREWIKGGAVEWGEGGLTEVKWGGEGRKRREGVFMPDLRQNSLNL